MLQIQDQQTPQRAHDRKYKLECRFLIRKKCEQAECGYLGSSRLEILTGMHIESRM